MKEKLKKYAKEILTLLVVIVVSSNVISLYKSKSLTAEALQMDSVKLINNLVYEVKNDEPVLVHVWATWCPICKVEAPNIQMLSEHFQVVTIAVKSGTSSEIKAFLDKNDYTYNVVNDTYGELSSKFNISAFPTTLIYDKNKNLVFSEVGYTSTLGLWLRMVWAGY
ncbi:Thiol-disulfide isomerase or thioredoxin [Epsilonproteobacteria bacterium SCGC AD-308-O04]|jgi:thiol-disulfide isomerase/thioredoxin|nr:Thiol-disulfide isomerase or thioredoxin [Epsilonproteobacteria bacterium SCGC AD-308-O04]